MWALKIIFKIIFSRLNIPYSLWKKFNVFKHGQMESFEYSRKIFEGHFRDMSKVNKIDNPVIMEIGPGDSLFSMIYSRKYSEEKFYLLDVNNFASKDLNLYLKLQKNLEKENYFPKKIKRKIERKIESFDNLLKNYNANYLVAGIESLKKIEDESIDYIFSHSVMEHVRKFEFEDLVDEMYRVLRPRGVISHNINYKDHLDESLNNLRFSEEIWESNLFASSGFYTNRLPAVEIHRLFKNKGFKLINENFGKWDKLPIKRNKVNNIFNQFSDRELAISTSSFLGMKI